MQTLYRGYRKSFEDDKLVSSLMRLREAKHFEAKRPNAIEGIEFSRVLNNLQALIDAKKRKEALMALVAARMRLSELGVSPENKERFEGNLLGLRAEIDAM